MSDILGDYREWAAGLPVRVSTHTDRCHMYHAECMAHRLARRLEEATLTDAEREAVWTVAEAYAENDGDPECEKIARVMLGLWLRRYTQD